MKRDRAALAMMLTSCVYLVIGMTLGILASMKLIWPSIGEIQILTFGRVRMLHTNVVLFAWLLQALMGIILYIIPRLMHTELFSEKLGMVTWALLNVSALGGAIAIMLGHNKGLEYAEIAPPFDYMISLTWVLFGLNIVLTIARRKVKYLYVTAWYTIGTIIWTTFVYVIGNHVTQLPFVKGINQANLTWFYVHNAVGLIFTPAGLAIAYYLIPKSLDTPIYSHKLSLIGFWVISFTYVWTGAHHMLHGPISYWLQTVAILFSWSLIIPVLAVITNFFGTFHTAPKEKRFAGPIQKFLYAATAYYLLTCLQGPFHSIRVVNEYVSKTDWIVGHAHMALLGAFSFIAMAGMYYAVPRITKKTLFSERLANWHFWLTFIGSFPFFAVLWVSGVVKGVLWQNPEITFLTTVKAMHHYHIMRWFFGFLILAGQFLFVYNIWETLFGESKKEDDAEYSEETAE